MSIQVSHGIDEPVISKTRRRRAIVVGSSIAGMLAARVLADHFEEVLVLERDQHFAGAGPRAGTPQIRHVHILLERGRRILEELFTGLNTELIGHGAHVVKMGSELALLNYHGWRVRYDGGLSLITFTRALLDGCLRRRLAAIDSLRCIEGCRVTGLLAGDKGTRVAGVHCQFSDEPRGEQDLYGDLIVDASGRFSRTPDWLSTLGYPPPKESVITAFLGYASRFYAAPEGACAEDVSQPSWKALLLLGKPPEHTRGGVLLPVEENRWHVTLVGIGKDYPPTDEACFLEFASTLRSHVLYDAIAQAQPVSTIVGYQATDNRRRHYESLSRWPEHFMVVGDALCAFNPIYGQGMSVAAMEAITLDRCLREYARYGGDMSGLAKKFQQQAARTVVIPWLMATGEDARWPTTEGGYSDLWTQLAHRYVETVTALTTRDPVIDHTFAEVAHLVRPAHTLLHPRVAIRVLARWLNPFPTLR